MREIIFRGKRLGSGEWAIGGYYKHVNRQLFPIGDRIRPKDINYWIIQPGYADWGFPRGVMVQEVDPETVGQWTGLVDSEGTEIFEGDILEIEKGTRKYRRQVKWFWHVQLPSFELVDADGFVPEGDIPGHLVWDEYGAYRYVIGNIYDNPELLKGGEA